MLVAPRRPVLPRPVAFATLSAVLVASLIGASVLGGPLTGRLRPFPAVLAGNGLLALGTTVAVVSIGLGATVPFLLGSVIAGTGFGTVFAGGLRLLLGGADQDARGGLLSAGFLVAYLGSAVPTFVAGRLTPGWGCGAWPSGSVHWSCCSRWCRRGSRSASGGSPRGSRSGPTRDGPARQGSTPRRPL
jgi:hypothetical protein